MNLQAIDKWHKTRVGHLTFGLFELLAVYLFASLAIDSGSLWQYAVTFLLFIGAIQNFVRVIRSSNHERARH
jgi:F0F1-type ATP synthase membrane subunit a